jgi:hypothetical protein
MNVKANLRSMKIYAWYKYLAAAPMSETANTWYDIYHLFAEEYDLM